MDGPRAPRVLVAGLGNVLMGDDAFGPWVVRSLEADHELPPGAVARDLGTPGLDLTPHLADLEALVVVDTVHADAAPGDSGALVHYATPHPRRPARPAGYCLLHQQSRAHQVGVSVG